MSCASSSDWNRAAPIGSGVISLALFGLALSLPPIVVVLFARIRQALDWIAELSWRLPFWTSAS